MLQVRSEVLVNNKPFETELLSPTDEARLVKYWDAGKGLKGHRYGQTSAKVIFVDQKFYTYAGPAELQNLFINIADQWLASGTNT